MKREKIGRAMQKILLCLYAGAALSLTQSPLQSFKIVKILGNGWKNINRRALNDAIKKLYQSKLLSAKENSDGTVEMILSEKGRTKAVGFNIETMKLPKPEKWDHLWRVVIFDIPEGHKKSRDTFSRTLKRVGFHKLQKSVFIYPYDCGNEIEFLIEFFDLRPFVRTLLTKSVDNDLHLKKIFRL